MTQKLVELFNLSPTEIAEEDLPSETSIAAIEETISALDKIDIAIPTVFDLDASDDEMDEYAKTARDKFESIFDLAMNVEAKFSAPLFQIASSMFGHALTAKQTKIDRKIKTIELQLKKAKLDMGSRSTDGDKLLAASDGSGVMLDRNELLKQILAKK